MVFHNFYFQFQSEEFSPPVDIPVEIMYLDRAFVSFLRNHFATCSIHSSFGTLSSGS